MATIERGQGKLISVDTDKKQRWFQEIRMQGSWGNHQRIKLARRAIL
ncbi:MAG: hypothetical protein ABIB93_07630 [Chloroflexota bacterium]